MAFSRFTDDMNIISALPDKPNEPPDSYSADALKAKFDEGASRIKTYLNNTLTPELEASGAAANIGASDYGTDMEFSSVQGAIYALKEKTDEANADAKEYAKSYSDSLHQDSTDYVDSAKAELNANIESTRADLENDLLATKNTFEQDIDNIRNEVVYLVSTPLTANTAAGMTDTNKVYVYTGTTGGGYTNGHWYYYKNGAWTDGGAYNTAAVNTDSTLAISGAPADAAATGAEISKNSVAIETLRGAVFSTLYTPAGFSYPLALEKGGFYSTTGAAFSSTGAYYRTSTNYFLPIGNASVFAVCGLPGYEWTCFSYSGLTWASATHSNTGNAYVPCERPIYIPKNNTDTRFCITFRRLDKAMMTTEEVSAISNSLKLYNGADETLSKRGAAADAYTTGRGFYGSKDKSEHTPAAFTWWNVPASFSAGNPIYPADVPNNSYTVRTGSLFGGFAEKGIPITHPSYTYWLFSWRSLSNSNIRFYRLYSVGGGESYIAATNDGGQTLSVLNQARKPSSKILWLGDSISRGRIGGESENYAYGIPWGVARGTGAICENFGIGNIGWCAGYSSSSPNKTNAIGYLKRVGDSDYYNANDAWSGYKFLGTGGWSDFNTIVFALGCNDNNYPLGSLADIDDSLSYSTVMSWKTSAADTDATNRTIVKAIYQCYRFVRESEAEHAEGEPYVPNGYRMNIILVDPIISGNTETGTPPGWGYSTVRAGGFTRLEMNQLLEDFSKKYGLGHISTYDAPIDRVHLANSLPDGVHPNRDTYLQLGRYFAGKVSALTL